MKRSFTGKPMRMIQAGMGGWGRNWYKTMVQPFPGADVVGMVDSDARARDACHKELGGDNSIIFESLDHALDNVEAEAVLITASLPGHVPLARQALNAGKHVLMEKPFAPSVDEAKELLGLAQRKRLTIMISQNYRFLPAPLAAAGLVREAALGALGVVHVDFRRDHVQYAEGRVGHFRLPHPLLADMAIHHFDLMRMITGRDASRIRCHAFHPPWSHYSDPPAAEAVVEMEDGPVVTYRGSWVSSGPVTPWAGEWRLEFEAGEVWFRSRGDDTADEDELWIRHLGKKAKRQSLPRVDYVDRAGSLAEFVSAIREGRAPITEGAANIGSIALTFAAIEASETGAWVDVPK